MRLLAALKTQIEFKKRLAPPSENDLVSEGPEGQGVRRGQHPTSLRSPWVGSKRVNRPHCGIVGGSATEMSKLPTRKKTGSWDRTILEGVPELAMPERTPLGNDPPPHLRSKVEMQKFRPRSGGTVRPRCHIAPCLGHLLPRANLTRLRPDSPVGILRSPSAGADCRPWGGGSLCSRLGRLRSRPA